MQSRTTFEAPVIRKSVLPKLSGFKKLKRKDKIEKTPIQPLSQRAQNIQKRNSVQHPIAFHSTLVPGSNNLVEDDQEEFLQNVQNANINNLRHSENNMLVGNRDLKQQNPQDKNLNIIQEFENSSDEYEVDFNLPNTRQTFN